MHHILAMAAAFGGNRGLQPVPPEKGVFPLDHLQECRDAMKAYMHCLKESKYDSEKCRDLSKKYLECRMERNLMVKQDLAELGFKDEEGRREGDEESFSQPSADKVREGFISGLPSRSERKR